MVKRNRAAKRRALGNVYKFKLDHMILLGGAKRTLVGGLVRWLEMGMRGSTVRDQISNGDRA